MERKYRRIDKAIEIKPRLLGYTSRAQITNPCDRIQGHCVYLAIKLANTNDLKNEKNNITIYSNDWTK